MQIKIYKNAKMVNPAHKRPYILHQQEIISRTINKMKRETYKLVNIASNQANDVILYFDGEEKALKPKEPIEKREMKPQEESIEIEKKLTWDDVKRKGSKHYKAGKIEPIDIYRDIQPHPSLTALDIKALTDNIKYSYRMLTNGANKEDCDKIIHYTEMVIFFCTKEKPDR